MRTGSSDRMREWYVFHMILFSNHSPNLLTRLTRSRVVRVLIGLSEFAGNPAEEDYSRRHFGCSFVHVPNT